MTVEHRIRLQAAWRVAAGGMVWTRAFGMPAGIGPRDRLWLEIAQPTACSATLNGRILPPVVTCTAPWRHDVTADLRDRNDLRLEFPAALRDCGAVDRVPLPDTAGSVALVIATDAGDPRALDMRSA